MRVTNTLLRCVRLRLGDSEPGQREVFPGSASPHAAAPSLWVASKKGGDQSTMAFLKAAKSQRLTTLGLPLQAALQVSRTDSEHTPRDFPQFGESFQVLFQVEGRGKREGPSP
jgi:hypothetical protein